MASTNASGIAWPRLGAEAVIIIASIPLALGVDEWRQGREDRKMESEYLDRLVDDLDANLAIAERQQMVDAEKVKHARRIYPLVSSGDMTGLDLESAAIESYLASPSDTPTWIDDAFEELLNTGRLSLIENGEIRRELSSFYRILEGSDWTYQLISRDYRDAIRARMHPDLQLEIREACRANPDCRIDTQAFGVGDFVTWLTANQELTEGLNRVIVQWT